MKETIVVIGGSAGALVAIRHIVRALPPGYPAAVLVCIHYPDDAPSSLARILERSGPLPARTLHGTEFLTPGRIGVAPPGCQVIVTSTTTRLEPVSREQGQRPSIDILFRSAAAAFGPRAVGVIVSGLMDDGTLGLAELARRGGRGYAQAPEEAAFDSMPRSAIEHVRGLEIAPAAEIGRQLRALAEMPAAEVFGPADGPLPASDLEGEDRDRERHVALKIYEARVAMLARLRASASERGDLQAERSYERLEAESRDRAMRLIRIDAARTAR